MKKYRILSLLLILVLLLSCMSPAVNATQIPGADTGTNTSGSPSSLDFGSVCVLQGCRTIDGNVPIGGAERRLDSAQAAFAFEKNTGTVVYSYNADGKVSPGGLTKIVTALVVLEHCDPEDVVIVSSRNISRLPAGSQNQNLKEGEQLTVNDLLHCLILASANDAAIALAEHVAGNQEAFVALMNQRVRQIGCVNTEFGNVHGLDNATQYTTARDMTRIVLEATRNEAFRDLFCATSYTVPKTNRNGERSFESQDYLVDTKNVQKYYDKRVTGGMQSASAVSGASIVYTASSRGMDMICVVMGCTRQMYENGWQVKVYGNFEEALDLLNYVYNTFKTCRVIFYGQALKQFAVNGGECDVVGVPHIDIDTILFADAYMKNLMTYYDDFGLTAPIAKDEMIATVQVWYGGCCLMEAELYALEGVRAVSETGVRVDGGADRGGSDSGFGRVVGIISAVILVPAVSYLSINALLRARRRSQHRRRRSGRRRS